MFQSLIFKALKFHEKYSIKELWNYIVLTHENTNTLPMKSCQHRNAHFPTQFESDVGTAYHQLQGQHKKL